MNVRRTSIVAGALVLGLWPALGAHAPGQAAAEAQVPAPASGGVVERFAPVGAGRVRAVLRPEAVRATRRPARVELPSRASGAARVEDEAAGISVAFALRGARDAALEVGPGGLVRYPGAIDGAVDLLQRVRADGTEDLVVFPVAPATEELVYTVDVHTAGLRLVSDSLELLDGAGVPRLRVAPPTVRGAGGRLHPARLTARAGDGSTCRVDTSPALPWRRPVLPACKEAPCRCELRVTWSGVGVVYPAVVDPAWTTTGDLASARSGHAWGSLHTGEVFVVGGFIDTSGQTSIGTMEIFDPATNVWTMGPALNVPRWHHSASVLSDGAILVVGGVGGSAPSPTLLHSVEKLPFSSSAWVSLAPMIDARQSHTASVLSGDRVLVAGGIPTASSIDDGSSYTEIYDPSSDSWSEGPQMNAQRKDHTATVIDPTHVLVAGGMGISGPTATAELLDVSKAQWLPLQPMTSIRRSHAAVLLLDGTVLVSGGSADGGLGAIAATEIFDPDHMAWRPGPPLTAARTEHSSTRLVDGSVLVAGGANPSERLASTEILSPDGGAWVPAGTMAHARSLHADALLPDGRVIVAGGVDGLGNLASAEIFSLLGGGAPCTAPGECSSGRCAAGVCCDEPCNGACEACTASEKGGGLDGVCGHAQGNPCGAFSCTPAEDCASTCSASQPCASGFVCSPAATCVPDGASCDGGTRVHNDGSTEGCGYFLCEPDTGMCRTQCSSNADCVEHADCGDGVCGPAPTNVDPGCGCDTTESATGGAAALTTALMVLWMARNRRPTRSQEGMER